MIPPAPNGRHCSSAAASRADRGGAGAGDGGCADTADASPNAIATCDAHVG